VGHGRGRRW